MDSLTSVIQSDSSFKIFFFFFYFFMSKLRLFSGPSRSGTLLEHLKISTILQLNLNDFLEEMFSSF